MDKLTAYKILGIDAKASTEAIKAAYAELSKKYHPEENPEEFQQLHEAYRILVRGNRGRSMENAESSEDIWKEAVYSRDEQTRPLQFKGQAMEVVVPHEDDVHEKKTVQYDFDAAEYNAQQALNMNKLQPAIDKLDEIIIWKNSVNEYTMISQMNELPLELLLTPQYIEKLYSILENRLVSDNCHELLMKKLQLYDEGLLEQYEYLAKLKELIDRKKEEYNSPEVSNRRNASFILGLFIIVLIIVFLIFK